jgi:hypothetical protein
MHVAIYGFLARTLISQAQPITHAGARTIALPRIRPINKMRANRAQANHFRLIILVLSALMDIEQLMQRINRHLLHPLLILSPTVGIHGQEITQRLPHTLIPLRCGIEVCYDESPEEIIAGFGVLNYAAENEFADGDCGGGLDVGGLSAGFERLEIHF